MAAMEYKISIPVMRWIADIKGSSLEDLAEDIAPKKRDKFLDGIVNKTQADKLIKIANIPFGFLFLTTPPEIEKPTLPDFRTIENSESLTDNFFDTLKDISYKIEWYKEHLSSIGALPDKLSYVGKFKATGSPCEIKIAADIAKTMNFDFETQRKAISKDAYFKQLSTLLEAIGILVFKNGVVKNNTRRALSVKEFRGFAIADQQVPVIFINGKDAGSAQLFTLMHEVAHIWLGESGVSNPEPLSDNKIERICNRVAAEFLVPRDIITRMWSPTLSINENIHEAASFFKVSRYVIAIKAYELNLINKTILNEIITIERSIAKKTKDSGSGGNFYNSFPVKNSHKFTNAVTATAMENKILLKEGASLLNTTPSVLVGYYEKNRDKF